MATTHQTRPITLNAGRVFRILLGCAVTFFAIHTILTLTVSGFSAATKEGVTALFNLNAEVSIPTWFSQTILLAVAVIAFLIGRSTDEHKKYKKHWMGIAGIFLYMSVDEGASIHELATGPMQHLLDVQSGFLYYSWVVLFGGIALVIGLLYLRFLWHLPVRTRWLAILAAVIFVAGALGMEMIEARLVARVGETSLAYTLLSGVEEFLEMSGVILAIYNLLDYYHSHIISIKID